MIGTLLDGVSGALDVAVEPSGVVFHRVPAAARTRLGDPALDFMSSVPSGVRLCLRTDAPWIELDADLIRVVNPGNPGPGSVFDVVLDGELRPPVTATEETLIELDPATGQMAQYPAGTATVRLVLGRPAAESDVEIWLPHAASFRLRDVRIPAGARIEPSPERRPAWVHHGSSISQGSEADRPTSTWPARVARATGRNLVNLGVGGQCHLDPFMARAIRDRPAAAISVEVGINIVNGDTMRERVFVSALHGFLDTVRDGHPVTPLVVVTPIVCPAAEDTPGPTRAGPDGRVRTVARPDALNTGALTLARVRDLIGAAVVRRRRDGDRHLHLLDGPSLFGPGDLGDLPDGLHPNDAGYRRMAERFLPLAFGKEGLLA